MDRRALMIVSVIAVLVGGGLVYSIAGGSDDSGPEVSAVPDTETTADSQAAPATDGQDGSNGADKADKSAKSSNPGQYVDYSPDLVASTPGTKLLFFHAPWCSQCNSLESDIEASTIPDDVTIFKVDYDTNQDLRQEYGVTIQTTVVEVDDQGNKVDDVVPYDEPTLSSVEQGLNL